MCGVDQIGREATGFLEDCEYSMGAVPQESESFDSPCGPSDTSAERCPVGLIADTLCVSSYQAHCWTRVALARRLGLS